MLAESLTPIHYELLSSDRRTDNVQYAQVGSIRQIGLLVIN